MVSFLVYHFVWGHLGVLKDVRRFNSHHTTCCPFTIMLSNNKTQEALDFETVANCYYLPTTIASRIIFTSSSGEWTRLLLLWKKIIHKSTTHLVICIRTFVVPSFSTWFLSNGEGLFRRSGWLWTWILSSLQCIFAGISVAPTKKGFNF